MSRLTMTSFDTSPWAVRIVLAIDSSTRQLPSLRLMPYSRRLPTPLSQRFSRRYEHPHAVVGMNLLKRRRLTQFRGSVAEHALVRRAVVQASSFDVDQSDHVRGVFGDHLEDLVLLPEFAVGVEDLQLLGDHENGVWGGTGVDLVPITSNQDVGPATRLKRMIHPVVEAGTFEAVLSRGPSALPAGTFPQPNYVTSALAFHSSTSEHGITESLVPFLLPAK